MSSATIDALLAELAAAELECREYGREANRISDKHGKGSVERVLHQQRVWPPIYDRHVAAVSAITAYALTWAAERAQSFVTAANQ